MSACRRSARRLFHSNLFRTCSCKTPVSMDAAVGSSHNVRLDVAVRPTDSRRLGWSHAGQWQVVQTVSQRQTAYKIISYSVLFVVNCVVDCNVRTQFQCDNGVCISRCYVCNRYRSCSDGSDERDCRECSPTYVDLLLFFCTAMI